MNTDNLMPVGIDRRNPKRWTIVIKNVSFLYRHRPKHKDVWFLSAYEFICYWEVALAKYPTSHEAKDEDAFHATLTKRGKFKMLRQKQSEDLKTKEDMGMIAGVDYVIKEAGGSDWLALPRGVDEVEKYRHTWILQRRWRSRDPSFQNCPMPRRGPGQQERTSCLLMTYLHPYTMVQSLADEHVPFVSNLRASQDSWYDALRNWFDGRVLCEEVRNYLNNYMAVTRARPDDDNVDADNSDDMLEDEDLDLDMNDLPEALETRMAGRYQPEDGTHNDPDKAFAFSLVDELWGKPRTTSETSQVSPSMSMDEERLKFILNVRQRHSERKRRKKLH